MKSQIAVLPNNKKAMTLGNLLDMIEELRYLRKQQEQAYAADSWLIKDHHSSRLHELENLIITWPPKEGNLND